jgi:hypothetical protein
MRFLIQLIPPFPPCQFPYLLPGNTTLTPDPPLFSALPDGTSIFEKTRGNKRHPFTGEDRGFKVGYNKLGTVWVTIEQNHRSTDLHDRSATHSLSSTGGWIQATQLLQRRSSSPLHAPRLTTVIVSVSRPRVGRRWSISGFGLSALRPSGCQVHFV